MPDSPKKKKKHSFQDIAINTEPIIVDNRIQTPTRSSSLATAHAQTRR